jgi:hypothetical protein
MNAFWWPEPEFINVLGARNRFQGPIPPAYVAWRNRFLGSLNVYNFGFWPTKGRYLVWKIVEKGRSPFWWHLLIVLLVIWFMIWEVFIKYAICMPLLLISSLQDCLKGAWNEAGHPITRFLNKKIQNCTCILIWKNMSGRWVFTNSNLPIGWSSSLVVIFVTFSVL